MNNKYTEFFKGIISFSNKIPNLKDKTPIVTSSTEGKSEDMIMLDNQFNNLLSADVVDICAEMEVNGYQISKEQKNVLNEKIIKHILNKPEAYVKFKKIYGDFDFEFKAKLVTQVDDRSRQGLLYHMSEDFKDSDFANKIINSCIEELNKSYTKIPKELSLIKYSTGRLSLNEGKSQNLMTKFVEDQNRIVNILGYQNIDFNFEKIISIKNLFIDMKSGLENLKPKIKAKNQRSHEDLEINHKRVLKIKTTEDNIEILNDIIESRKDIAKTQIINNLRVKNLENGIKIEVTHKYQISDLPEETKKLIKEIDLSYQKISISRNAETTILIEQKIQDVNSIVTKFMAIDKDYRDSLKNIEGKTPFDLMMNSLNIIKSDFEALSKEKNQEIVNDLSVLNRKTTAKRIIN